MVSFLLGVIIYMGPMAAGGPQIAESAPVVVSRRQEAFGHPLWKLAP